jgi:exopolysaccharide biosynthesis protein
VVGLSNGDAVLLVAAVTRETSQGLTLRQAAQMLQQLGAVNALNLDGGGSTSLAVDGGGGKATLLNIPSDPHSPCTHSLHGGCERFVGASFGIHARPLRQRP